MEAAEQVLGIRAEDLSFEELAAIFAVMSIAQSLIPGAIKEQIELFRSQSDATYEDIVKGIATGRLMVWGDSGKIEPVCWEGLTHALE